MDNKETNTILTEQRLLSELLSNQGWPIARRKLLEYLEELKNVDNLDASVATALQRDVQARKYARVIISSWLAELEGSKEVVNNNPPPANNSHIVNFE